MRKHDIAQLSHIDWPAMLHITEEIDEHCTAIMQAKNSDYANQGESPVGVFGNLSLCEALAACTTEQGISIRLLDKVSRLNVVLSKGGDAKVEESLIDTFCDIINYSRLGIAAVIAHSNNTTLKGLLDHDPSRTPEHDEGEHSDNRAGA